MSQPQLTTDILKSVSRSFYLSIRFLPAKVREPIGMAYLLARASDTIADSETALVGIRQQRLTDFHRVLKEGADLETIRGIQRDIVPTHDGEKALLAALPQCLERFAGMGAPDRQEVLAVLGHIIRGQSNDLAAFPEAGQLRALPDAATLDDYTYCVAGSVGEFWTRVCFLHDPEYAKLPQAELIPLGINLGKTLQLVNILRDMPSDLRAGRCYLPASELQSAGITLESLGTSPTLAQPVFDHWMSQAWKLHADGATYIRALHSRRIRFACTVPWLLAGSTLRLLETRSPLSTPERLKVSRGTVRKALWRSVIAGFSDRPLRGA